MAFGVFAPAYRSFCLMPAMMPAPVIELVQVSTQRGFFHNMTYDLIFFIDRYEK